MKPVKNTTYHLALAVNGFLALYRTALDRTDLGDPKG